MSSEYQELLEKLLNSDTTDVIPQSRAEYIMLTAINSLNIDTLPEPSSRMEAYLMALITKMGEGGSASQTQSDWNQNDSTQPDYVKNKTHYYSVKEITTFSPVNSTEQVLLVPFSNIPELVCVDINGQRFEGLSLGGLGYIGDQGTAEWNEGKGYGFYFKLDKSTKNTRCAVDTRRFGVRPNCILYGMYVDKKIPYYYLPYPTAKTPGAVKAEYMNDLLKYEPCVIDDAGTVYSRKYAPAQVFSDLSGNNLKNELSYVGDHGIFTDRIAEDISSVSELVLPVHAWKIFYNGRYVAYLLESADGRIVKFTYNLGGTGIAPNVEVLRTPSTGGSLIVTFNPDDSTKATHSSSEIYEAVQSGKTVRFYANGSSFQLRTSTPDKAVFTIGGLTEGNAIGFMTFVINDNSGVIILGPAFVPTIPATMEVGQTIVVKSVDGNGQPTEWEAVGIPTVDDILAALPTWEGGSY